MDKTNPKINKPQRVYFSQKKIRTHLFILFWLFYLIFSGFPNFHPTLIMLLMYLVEIPCVILYLIAAFKYISQNLK